MTKQVSQHLFHSDDLEWLPWEETRDAPFSLKGASGRAWVKILSRDPESRAESVLYKFEEGWRAPEIRNTVSENLIVLDGEMMVGEHTLKKHSYGYRPPGYSIGPCTTPSGAVVLSYMGSPGDSLTSKRAIDALDTERMAWRQLPVKINGNYSIKILRGDEMNLDIFSLYRVQRNSRNLNIEVHEEPEEGFYLDGESVLHDGVTQGKIRCTRGMYVMRGPWSPHGKSHVIETTLTFNHSFGGPVTSKGKVSSVTDEVTRVFLASYPEDTPQVLARKEGREPDLPKRW